MKNDFTDLIFDPEEYVPVESVYKLEDCGEECEIICDFINELLLFSKAVGKYDFHNLYSIYEYFLDIGLQEEV